MTANTVVSVESGSSASGRFPRLEIPLSDLIVANRQRDALYALSERLLCAETVGDVHDAALQAVEAALECDRAAVLLFDEASTMRFVAWHGLSENYRTAVTGHSPWSADAIDPAPIPIPDIDGSSLDAELKSVVLAEGIRATAFIPLLCDGRLIGKFMAYFREPHAFTPQDLAVSLIIARQLAFSIQRLRSEQALREQRRELADELAATAMLQTLSLELAQAVDSDTLYGRIVDAALALMHSDFASLQRLYPQSGDGGQLKLLTHRGFSPEAAQFWSWVNARSSCPCGQAFLTRRRVITADLECDPRVQGSDHGDAYRQVGVRAVQSTPLISGRGVMVGMISTHWQRPHEPSAGDLRRLDILARLAADLIERHSYDEELRTREERARTLTQLLSDVPWQARADGAFEELQPAWENYTGQTWDDHAGHGWFQAIHPDDRDAARTSWATSCFYAQPYEFQARLWHAASQSFRRCVIRATPIRHEDGSLREWVGACTDIRALPG